MNTQDTNLQIVSLIKTFEQNAIMAKIKSTFENFPKLKDNIEIKIGKPEQVPNHLLITFSLPYSHAFDVIKSLVIEGVPIISEVPIIKRAIREARYELQIRKVEAVQNMKKKKKKEDSNESESKNLTLEELIESGDWQTLLIIAKNKSVKNVNNSKKILEIMPDILQKIIEVEVNREHDRLSKAEMSFERLSKIAANIDLKIFRFFSVMTAAGEAAISICLKYPKELISELITLMNHQNTTPHIKIKSFLTFYDTVKSNPDLYMSDITFASKNINVRALNNCILTAFNLSNSERIQFRDAVEFFGDFRRTGKIAV